ncbi:hypothetical protein D3C83_110260 [compost metagenome]
MSMPPSVQVALASGTAFNAIAIALMIMSLSETFQAGLPSLSLGAAELICSRNSMRASISVSMFR